MASSILRRSVFRSLPSIPLARRFFSAKHKDYTSGVVTEEVGAPGTMEYRLFFNRPGVGRVSPFHDVPLRSAEGPGLFYYVNEIPRGTRPKMEIDTKSAQNPIKQDIKKGALRNFTYGDLPFNYGAFPQTWEDPNIVDGETGCKGDNDPLDVVEIGSAVQGMGKVTVVKPLGCLALIDEGELDWKVVAISIEDPLASQLNDLEDVQRLLPDTLPAIRHWFQFYKTTDGKPENAFGFNGEFKDREFTLGVIAETHERWESLVKGSSPAGELWIPSA